MTTPPPPTALLRLDAPQAVVDRLTRLWSLATTDDQRWEIERLAEGIDEAVTSLLLLTEDGHGLRPLWRAA